MFSAPSYAEPSFDPSPLPWRPEEMCHNATRAVQDIVGCTMEGQDGRMLGLLPCQTRLCGMALTRSEVGSGAPWCAAQPSGTAPLSGASRPAHVVAKATGSGCWLLGTVARREGRTLGQGHLR